MYMHALLCNVYYEKFFSQQGAEGAFCREIV